MPAAALNPGTVLDRLGATPWFERLLAPALMLLLGLILVFADTRVYRDFLYAVVIPLALLAAPRLRPGVLLRSPLWWLAVAYAAYFVVALPFVGTPDLREVYDVVRRLLAVMLFLALLVCLRARDPTLDRRLFGWLGCVGAAAGLYAVRAFYAAHPLSLRIAPVPALVPESTDSPIANPNISGCLAAVIGLGLLHHRVLGAPRRAQALLWALPLAGLTLFIAGSASRAVLAGLAAALIATAVVRRELRPLAVAAVLAGLLYLGLVALGVLPPPGLFERGDSHRLFIWQQAWALALQRPWFGYGVSYPIAFAMPEGDVIHHAHSAYLAHLVLGGVAGLALYLALLVLMARAALARYRRDGNFANAALTIFIAVQGAFDFSAFVENAGWQWIHFWLPLGLMAGGELAAARADGAGPAPATPAHA